MIRDQGEVLAVSGAMTLATAAALLAAGRAALKSGETVFDLGGIESADSSALAVIFGWQRAALARQGKVRIINPPGNLKALAALYGTADVLPL